MREKMNLLTIVDLINEQSGHVILPQEKRWIMIGEKRLDEFQPKNEEKESPVECQFELHLEWYLVS